MLVSQGHIVSDVHLVAVLLVGQLPGHAPHLLVSQPVLQLLQQRRHQIWGLLQVVNDLVEDNC